MEYMLLENLITMFLRRWLMHKISQLIKSKVNREGDRIFENRKQYIQYLPN